LTGVRSLWHGGGVERKAKPSDLFAGISLSDRIIFCLAGIIAIALAFKHDTQWWSGVLLIALWLLVFYPTYHLIVRDGRGFVKFCRVLYGLFFVTLGVGFFGLFVWPEEGLGMLTQSQMDRFSEVLKTQSEPILIHLMCPPNDQKDCVVAGQFIGLFRKNGWKVRGNIVERVLNGSPKAGFYFVLHSTVDPDPGNPEGKTGAWTTMPNAYYTVNRAFSEFIKTDLVVGFDYPDKELGLYFGFGTAKP
jgi:hypothetical protein